MKNKVEFFENNKGFSLIEISIVIIIIGILVTAVFAGTGLIKSSKVLTVNNEINKYASATELFIGKYSELPGIMLDPVRNLGSEAKKSPNVQKTDADGKTTTNTTIINASGKPTDAESLNFFNHLSLAGLLDDEHYIGSNSNLGSVKDITKQYYPFSKGIKDHFYYVRGDAAGGSFNQINRVSMGNINNEDGNLDADIIDMLDSKYDDGFPLTGNISIVPKGSSGTTATE